MNFTFENQGANSYLVYELNENDRIDSLSLGMLTNNRIPGIASTLFTQMNETKYVKYNISSRITARQLFESTVNRKRLLGVLNGIVDAMLSAEEYMLNPGSLLFDLDYIFINIATGETVLICLPLMDCVETVDYNAFIRKIMTQVQYDRTEDYRYVAEIITSLQGVFLPEDLKKVLESIAREEIVDRKPETPISKKEEEEPARPQKEIEKREEIRQPEKKNKIDMDQRLVEQLYQRSPVVKSQPVSSETKQEKGMSLWYLLQHYSKENRRIYQEQKEEKEGRKLLGTYIYDKDIKNAGEPGIPFDVPGQGRRESTPHASLDSPKDEGLQIPVQVEKKESSSNEKKKSGGSAIPKVKKTMGVADFGDTVYGDSDETGATNTETTVMDTQSDEKRLSPHLIYRRNNERIPITEKIFRLGRTADFNQYAIPGNVFIGHSHCHIITKNGEYFVVDDNSKNHTYVDGVIVSPGTEVKIAHGQILKLANEEFEFRLY